MFLLAAVNDDIENIQARSSEMMEEVKSLQGDLVIKNQKVAEQDLQLKWFVKKREIFAEQKGKMEKEEMELLGYLV